MQNCTIQIAPNECLSPPGSISITNNSRISAKNIRASSGDINFMTYVVQNNGCPASLPPGASCTISFSTNASVAFSVSNVTVKGSNTTSTSFNINAVQCAAPTITGVPSPNRQVGIVYNQSNIASGGKAPYSYSLNSGTLPAGTSLNSATGTVSGIPTTAGAFSYVIQVTDAYGSTAIVSSSGTIVNIFPVAAGPSNVIAVPGNSQVTVSWTAPTNVGTGTVTSYTVTYGPTSGTVFTTPGCTTTGSPPSTSCTINGLTNNTAYTFAVTTTTAMDGVNETGPATLSSSVIPTSGLVVSPSTLLLSGIGGGTLRTITVTNVSPNPIIIDSVSSPLPALPGDASVDTSSPTTCNIGTILNPNNSCTITINPGLISSSSSGCTDGITLPTSSTITITGNSGSITANAEAMLLGYGCQYQGGYLFAIDDTTLNTNSIGGKVTMLAANSIMWSPLGVHDSIWGIDNTSTSTLPSPNASSFLPATLKLGQLNCNGKSDGTCNTENIFVYYEGTANYAAGICKQPLSGAGVICTGGANCYTDWYLPSICDLDATTFICPSTQSIVTSLSFLIPSVFTGDYWSSTESLTGAWFENFSSIPPATGSSTNNLQFNVSCIRNLTS
ncbi:fibronectin type III domain-containing protein [Legionella drancourtii]|nr:fibronectin type III domain-containing protein [Legionella drancourtii]